MDEFKKYYAPMSRYLSIVYHENIEKRNLTTDGYGSIVQEPDFYLTLKQYGVLSLLHVGFASSRAVRHFDLGKNVSRAKEELVKMKDAGLITIEEDTTVYAKGGNECGARAKEYGFGEVVMNGFNDYYKRVHSMDAEDVEAREERQKEGERLMAEAFAAFK